ncbi:MAG: NAD(P)-dependent oxidoreductase [Flavobacteriaceae bacterium]|nr:NAD(P)-dependent oxidoreductase [Flavobacteriaceae bacterium]
MRILHLDTNHPILEELLAKAGFENHFDLNCTKEELLQKIETYDALIIRSRIPIDAEVLSASKRLKCVGRVGAGLENIDLETAQQLGIRIVNAPEGNSNAVAEHCLGMLLSLLHKIPEANLSVKQGNWLREAHRGTELGTKTVGIIGYGTMGKAFAQKISGLCAECVCVDILPHKGDEYARQVPLDELFEIADVLSIHTPLTSKTTLMVNAAFLNRFHKPIYLLNTARGKIVETAALVQSLAIGKVIAAGLDVLEFEKSSFEQLSTTDKNDAFQALIQHPKVLLSPHVAGWTKESNFKLAQITAQRVINCLDKN